jgi:hypothetical protein
MDESQSSNERPGGLLARIAKRACWHLFGALTTAVFMVAAMSLTKGNSWLSSVPDLAWIFLAIAGFAGILRYARWYRS